MNIQELMKNPDFNALPDAERQKVIDFMALPEPEQAKVREYAQLRQGQPDWKYQVSDALHMGLPIAGGMAGGVIGGGAGLATGPGAPVMSPTLAASGGAGGFAIGEQAADIFDEQVGIQQPPEGWTGAAAQAAGNIYQGVQAEALGQGIGAGLTKVAIPAAKRAYNALLPYGATGAGSEKKMADELVSLRPNLDEIANAKRLEQEVPGLQSTTGMAADNRGIIGLERGASSSADEAYRGVDDELNAVVGGNIQAVKDKVRGASAGIVDDFTDEITTQVGKMEAQRATLAAVDRQSLGNEILYKLDEATTPIKKVMTDLESKIPDYPIDISSTKRILTEIFKEKSLSSNQRGSVEKIMQELKKAISVTGESTQSMIGFRRTLNDDISKAMNTGDTSSAAVLLRVKEALDSDFGALSAMVKTGKIAEYQGRMVNTDNLASELTKNIDDIAKLSTREGFDQKAIEAGLKARKYPFGRQTAESQEGYLQRIADDYKRVVGETPPIKQSEQAAKRIADLEARNANIQAILQEVEPGKDVAALLNAYNRFSSSEYFGRFGKGAVANATRTGNQAIGTQSKAENISGLFASSTGSADLARALPNDAKNLLRKHYQSEVSELLSRNPNDKTMGQWIKQNRQQLEKNGLFDEFDDIIKSQAGYNELKKIGDIDSVFTQILSGNTNQQNRAISKVMRRVQGKPLAKAGLERAYFEFIEDNIIKQLAAGREGFGNALSQLKKIDTTTRTLFGKDASKIAAVSQIRKAIEITQRIQSTSVLGGSQTAELSSKIKGAEKGQSSLSQLAKTLVYVMGGGGAYAATPIAVIPVAGAALLREVAEQSGRKAMNRFFAKAMFDKEYAITLIKASRARQATSALRKEITERFSKISGQAIVASQQQDNVSP